MFSRPRIQNLLCALALVTAACTAHAGTLADPNFSESVFVSDATRLGNVPPSTDGQDNGITSMKWAPDGSDRLYLTVKGRSKKNAFIQVVRNGVLQSIPFYTFNSGFETHNECGLMSLVFHPNYASGTRQIYCFITVSPREQQIMRFDEMVDENGNYVAAGPPVPVVKGIPTNGEIHNGGALAIAPDQNGHGQFLYWSCGNNGIDRGNRLNLDSMGSKVSRANLDGSIPTDGLNASGYIWALGYRNPFRMATQPATGKIWVCVVGEIYEQVYIPVPGSWAGDKDFEGNAIPPDPALRAKQIFPVFKYRTGSVDKRPLANANGAVRNGNIVTFTTTVPHRFTKGEKITLTGISPASFNEFVYVLATPTDKTFTAECPGTDPVGSGGLATTQNIGNCISGGGFNDKNVWPPAYRGNFFVGEYGSGRITRVQLDPDNSAKKVDSFLTNGGHIIDVSFGPDGNMYYAVIDSGTVHKVIYTALLFSTDAALPPTTVGAQHSQALSVTGEKGALNWTIASGKLPAGLSLNTSSGVIDGTPIEAGTFNFTVNVADKSKGTGHREFKLVVNPPPSIAAAELPGGKLGVELNLTFAKSGGSTPHSWSITAGALPAGVALNSSTGALSGKPSATGTFAFTVTLKDAANVLASRAYSVVVAAGDSAPAIISAPAARANAGAPYSYAVNADGYPRPTYTLASAPPGMTINSNTGEITWLPKTVGKFDVAVKATNRIAPEATQTFSLTVESYGLATRPLAKPHLGLSPAALPATLSGTGVFADTAAMKASAALIPYTVNSPLWSDRAAKTRWISVPNTGESGGAEKVGFSPTGEWTFPSGTLFVKHFELITDERNPALKKRLETRLLFVQNDGAVFGATYKWRADGSDADLLLQDGVDEDVSIAATNGGTRVQRWHYPSRAECLLCHTSAAGGVLGLKTRQQNGELTYPGTGVTDNQLRSWNHIGLFKESLDEAAIATYPKLVRVTDTAAPLELRVRSYMDANCSNCHRPGGAPAVFDARFDTPLFNQNIVNGNVNKDLGIPGAKTIIPRDPVHSVMELRMKSVDPTVRMPALARNLVDTDAVDAMEQWIKTLPDSGTGLTAEYFDSAELKNLKLTRIDGNVDFDCGIL